MALLEKIVKKCKKNKEFQEEIDKIKYCTWRKRIPCAYQNPTPIETNGRYKCNLEK